MAFNINTQSVTRYLSEPVTTIHTDDLLPERVAILLTIALKRPLCRELANQPTPTNLTPIRTVTPEHPLWVHTAIAGGDAIYDFKPERHLVDHIDHIADWLAAALLSNERWLHDCDPLGRPKKLLKFGSLDQAVREADRDMLRQTRAPVEPLGAEHTKVVKAFPDGAAILQLLSERSLDAESHAMGHCVGLGSYDQKLNDGTHSYYSLRSPSGKACATMEVRESDNTLLQCKGRANQPPVSKYMPYVQDFVQEQRIQLHERPAMTGLIQQDDRYYDINNLPENFACNGDLDLSETKITRLPNGLNVQGDLKACHTDIKELPDRLHVSKSIDLSDSKIERLPPKLTVNQDLILANTPIKHLPRDLCVKGDLDLNFSDIEQLPQGLKVGQDLHICGTIVGFLPAGLEIGGSLRAAASKLESIPPDIKIGRDLIITDSTVRSLPPNLTISRDLEAWSPNLQELPPGLTVGRDLLIPNTRLKTLPPDLSVGRHLNINRCHLNDLPENLRVPGALSMLGAKIDKLPTQMDPHGKVYIDHQTRLPSLPTYFSGKLHRRVDDNRIKYEKLPADAVQPTPTRAPEPQREPDF